MPDNTDTDNLTDQDDESTIIEELPRNSFTSHELTIQDTKIGAVFTSLQIKVLENRLSKVAEEKIRLDYDIDKHLDFVQQDAYKRGELDMLTYLLDCSDFESTELNPITFNQSQE